MCDTGAVDHTCCSLVLVVIIRIIIQLYLRQKEDTPSGQGRFDVFLAP